MVLGREQVEAAEHDEDAPREEDPLMRRHRLQLLEVEPTACMDGYIGSGVGDLGGGSRVHPRQRLARVRGPGLSLWECRAAQSRQARPEEAGCVVGP